MKLNKIFLLLLITIFISGCVDILGLCPGSYQINGDSVDFEFCESNDFQVLKDVDIKTFEILENNKFAKDKLNVYYLGSKIEGVDSNSFEIINYEFAKDKNFLYNVPNYGFKMIKINKSDSKTFKIIDSSEYRIYYAKDKNLVYLDDSPVYSMDVKTIEKIGDSHFKDKNNIYFESSIIHNADRESFEIMTDRYYSKDKNNIYYDAKIISEVDRESFEIIDPYHAKDKYRTYKYGVSPAKLKLNTSECYSGRYHVGSCIRDTMASAPGALKSGLNKNIFCEELDNNSDICISSNFTINITETGNLKINYVVISKDFSGSAKIDSNICEPGFEILKPVRCHFQSYKKLNFSQGINKFSLIYENSNTSFYNITNSKIPFGIKYLRIDMGNYFIAFSDYIYYQNETLNLEICSSKQGYFKDECLNKLSIEKINCYNYNVNVHPKDI